MTRLRSRTRMLERELRRGRLRLCSRTWMPERELRRGRLGLRSCLVALIAASCLAPIGTGRAAAQDVGTDAQREAGKALYGKYCSQCHGEKGDGEGYAASHLYPRPRNFTTGKFKIRTTPNGALPTHQDLVNVIKRGMPYTSMPAWTTLSDEEVSDLAYYVTTFSPDFASPERAPKPIALPSAPSTTKESIALGSKLYAETGCVRCHGTKGRGDGPSGPTLTDDWGHAIRAADLAQNWTFRGGSSREDIFRTMSTGLNGTPMPSFADSAPPGPGFRATTDSVPTRPARAARRYAARASHAAGRRVRVRVGTRRWK